MNSYWIAYLSDGQVVKQKDLEEVDATLSAWLQLLKYLNEHKELEIRNIQLVVNGRVYNTPSLSTRASFVSDGKPCRLWCYQKVARDIIGGDNSNQHFLGLSYRLGEYRHYTWVDTTTNESYIEICNLDNPREQTIENFYNERN